jgi:phosphoribosyl 1,2-cyclic phosphodiesterase
MSDTGYSPYRFEGLTSVAIEANYSERILRENVENGSIPRAHMLRVLASHMSVERAVDLLKANDLSRVEEIHLLHLSDGNSHADEFQQLIARATGKPVYVAGRKKVAA